MDSDFGPSKQTAKSLRKTLDTRGAETKTNEETAFRTPQEVAASDTAPLDIKPVNVELEEKPAKRPAVNWKQKLQLHWPPGRKEAITAILLLVVVGAGLAVFMGRDHNKPVAAVSVRKIPKKVVPATVTSLLTGRQVEPMINTKPVVGVMIENSQEARPQSGLSDAGVVFEAIAEGGITRFLALFQDTAPADIGPVRSARPYYLEWALGFDAAYAHVGGSPQALADIKNWNVRDLDQFFNAGSYRRISSRAAPHNVYTSVDTLTQLAVSKGFNSSNYTGFVRQALTDKPAVKKNQTAAPSARAIDLKMSGPLYNVRYDYNSQTKTYNRSEGGAPHMDANGNKQISPDVVVAMVVPYNIAGDGLHSEYQAVGSGAVTIFQAGQVFAGNWSKADQRSQIKFTDAAGKPIPLNPGQTWVTVVSDATKISYTP